MHFGSCGTMRIDKRNLRRFLDTAGADAVLGYKEEVDWLKSAAFETLLFDIVVRSSPGRLQRAVESEAKGLARELGFRIVRRNE